MNSIVVFVPSQTSRAAVVTLLSELGTVTQTEQTIVLDSGESRLYLDPLTEPEAYYEPAQLDVVRGVLGSYLALVVSYRDVDLVRQFIVKIAGTWPSVIDNDHELIAPGFEYLRRIKLDPGWNWDDPEV